MERQRKEKHEDTEVGLREDLPGEDQFGDAMRDSPEEEEGEREWDGEEGREVVC